MSRSKLGFVGAQTESEIIEFASDRRTSDKKVVTGWQSVSCRCPHGVEQSAVNSHCCVNCAFIPSSIHRILPIRCRYYLQRNMLLTTMLGDLAVFWLYVTLICSFLHYITLHYITLQYSSTVKLHFVYINSNYYIASFFRQKLTVYWVEVSPTFTARQQNFDGILTQLPLARNLYATADGVIWCLTNLNSSC